MNTIDWKSVTIVLPLDGVDVLIFARGADTEIMIGHRIDGDWYEQNLSIDPPIDIEVTHWAPLPQGPLT